MAIHGFRRARAGRVVVRLSQQERTLLAELSAQLVELVSPAPEQSGDPLARLVGIDPDASTPEDPAVHRLFPDGYGAGEPERSAEFRRFTERSLREGKAANAAMVLATLQGSGDRGRVVLGEQEAQAWLGTLNDMRLTIGTRIGVTEDIEDRALGMADEQLAVLALYDWLTFLQGTLVEALMGSAEGAPERS